MQITLDVAEDLACHLAVNLEGLSRAALEALALEGARSGKLTTEQVRRLLGFVTRYEADGCLKQHDVYHPWSREDVQREAETALKFSQSCSSSPIRPR
ncbi:MAG: UPF0175 family protein [Acidobacteriaceae bacterium]|nr:UPF0175 family protein [Acidobacteriaceae bacterium]MBV9305237.1 UPF0175 family protein [Acidobacteriaceae bacterium]